MAEIHQLETSILELGTEMFRLKHQILEMKNVQSSFLKTLSGLKGILDRKGIINSDDFDVTIEANQMMEEAELDSDYDSVASPIKKEMN